MTCRKEYENLDVYLKRTITKWILMDFILSAFGQDGGKELVLYSFLKQQPK